MIDSECSCLPRNRSLRIEREKQRKLWFDVYEYFEDYCGDKLYVLINCKWKDLDTWIFCEACLKERGGPISEMDYDQYRGFTNFPVKLISKAKKTEE